MASTEEPWCTQTPLMTTSFKVFTRVGYVGPHSTGTNETPCVILLLHQRSIAQKPKNYSYDTYDFWHFILLVCSKIHIFSCHFKVSAKFQDILNLCGMMWYTVPGSNKYANICGISQPDACDNSWQGMDRSHPQRQNCSHGFVHSCIISDALTMEISQCCMKPLI